MKLAKHSHKGPEEVSLNIVGIVVSNKKNKQEERLDLIEKVIDGAPGEEHERERTTVGDLGIEALLVISSRENKQRVTLFY